MAKEKPKVVILAGGLGTRISEESDYKPKPMVEVGGMPILRHIMAQYAKFGFQDFVVCVGYKGEKIKDYFLNLQQHSSDFSIDYRTGKLSIIGSKSFDWRVTVVDTGTETLTGGRLRRVADLLGNTFFMTYGDGVSTVDIAKQLAFHEAHGRLATVLAVRPPSRFAVLTVNKGNKVVRFEEKPKTEVGWISGGFFVLNKPVLDLIEGDDTIWEKTPLQKLARDGELMSFRHTGFWHAVDTLHDKRQLELAFQKRAGPWRLP